ncbi:type I methionyl aminopeptidase [Candidatus Dojkabacteria bacterium]|nr:type I methionyl aminopeptidase [Candidatus Dojkabacteria bacterium]
MEDKVKIKRMKEAADILSPILREISDASVEGVNLLELEDLAIQLCRQYKVKPAFKGYEGYPAALCLGVNDVVNHGIPYDYELKNGDILGIDMGVKYQSVYSDCAVTVTIGEVSDEVKKFLETTKQAVLNGIKQAKPGNTVGDIGYAMQTTVEKEGYSVVKEMVGHGVGYELHEEPYIPGYGRKGDGEKLYKGQTIAIEAIINQGRPEIKISRKDGWTASTKDGMLSALFEHTVVVDDNPRILTKW